MLTAKRKETAAQAIYEPRKMHARTYEPKNILCSGTFNTKGNITDRNTAKQLSIFVNKNNYISYQ